MMPLIYIFGIILVIRVITLDSPVRPDWSPLRGMAYMWTPRWQDLNWSAAIAATGQIFFTLSLGMGIIANYASYIKPDSDIVLSSLSTITLNEFAEVILGGTIVIPIVYTYLGVQGMQSGVGLSFIALPNIFRNMAGGQLFGGFWFLILFFAGFTSAMAMYNYVVATLEDNFKIKRRISSWITFFICIIVGLPVGLEPILTGGNTAYLSGLDFWVGNLALILLALIEVIIFAWLVGKNGLTQINTGSYWKLSSWFYTLFIQFLAPVTLIIFIFGFIYEKITEGKITGMVNNYWASASLIVTLSVFLLGVILSFFAITKIYKDEIKANSSL